MGTNTIMALLGRNRRNKGSYGVGVLGKITWEHAVVTKEMKYEA